MIHGIIKPFREALEKDQNNQWTGKDHKESNTDVQQQVRFQNDESILRLAVCIVIDINREWVTYEKHLNEED